MEVRTLKKNEYSWSHKGQFLLDTDKDISVSDVIEYEGKSYVCCAESVRDKIMHVRPINVTNTTLTEYEDEVKCPYCGFEDGDSWELDEEGETDCGNCGAKLAYSRTVEVTYSAELKEKPETIKL